MDRRFACESDESVDFHLRGDSKTGATVLDRDSADLQDLEFLDVVLSSIY